MITLIAKCLKILNSEVEPGQISLALCFSMIMGFTPITSLHNLIVLFAVLVLRVNLTAFILGLGVFSAVAYLLDPLFHMTGDMVLRVDFMAGLWTAFYNNAFMRTARFNNTIVMGSLLISLILFIPSYFLGNLFIQKYRTHLLVWIEKVKLVQIMKTSKLYTIYKTLS